MPRCEVVRLLASDNGDRVTGVHLLRHDNGSSSELSYEANLVVDATGRSGRATTWLTELGYQPPTEELVPVGVKYVTQRLRIAPDALGRIRLVLVGAQATRPSTLFFFAQEDNWWSLTAGGYEGHHPPTDREPLLEFIRTMVPEWIFTAVRDAEPLTQPVTHRFPANLRRRYEHVPRFPAGLVVFGDAVCSFNPVYGQGMTVAAMQAVALCDCLAKGENDLPRRFFRAAAKPIDVAWQFAAGADLALPQVPGGPPATARMANSYVDWLLTAAEQDAALAEAFFRVTGFVDPPARLFRPSVVRRGIAGNWRRRVPL
jgi:2-polyprenyl-6-methoxyphenol hydroxylase-like FAD-dependent oxidoreductase